MRFDGACPVDSPDAPQCFPEDFSLVPDLAFAGHVLIAASATHAEVRAPRGNSLWGWIYHCEQARAHILFLFLHGGSGDRFARKYERNKYRCTLRMAKPFAAINEFFDLQVHEFLPVLCSEGFAPEGGYVK